MTYPLLTAQHLTGARIIERDPRGIKVLQLPNADYLKVFRLRHRFSWARFQGYAQRFAKHASTLAALGIPTLKVIDCYQVKDARLLDDALAVKDSETAQTLSHTFVVHYAPLPGDTLKHLLDQQQLQVAHIKQLGAFIAELHAKGIHFRSLHFGNIVLTPEGKMGLIDIADMKIYPWALWFGTRLRSFRHLTRYARMNVPFGISNWAILVDSYIEHAALSPSKANVLKKKMQHFLLHPPH
ncbi:MAG: toluene tolerance protein [Methylophilus sp.]|uniref:toluene tolerance protein n=1 Tax=Methylophilus sp. TaxID=29541 RepID=UPI003FA19595